MTLIYVQRGPHSQPSDWEGPSPERRRGLVISIPLVSTSTISVSVDWTREAWVKGFTNTEPEVCKRINICYYGIGKFKK